MLHLVHPAAHPLWLQGSATTTRTIPSQACCNITATGVFSHSMDKMYLTDKSVEPPVASSKIIVRISDKCQMDDGLQSADIV